jgi:hypothetical protein
VNNHAINERKNNTRNSANPGTNEMNINLSKLVIAGTLAAVSGCASSSDEIGAAYVSPLTYQNYSCDQIRIEMNRLRSRVSALGGQLDEKASADDWQMGIGLVLFWPTLFFIDGDGTEAAEYARIKGESEALEQAATMKNCMSPSTSENEKEKEEIEEAEAETEDEVKARIRAEVIAEMDAETKAEAEGKEKAKAEEEIKAEIKAELEAEMDAETKAEAESTEKAKAEEEIKAEIKAELEAEMTSKPAIPSEIQEIEVDASAEPAAEMTDNDSLIENDADASTEPTADTSDKSMLIESELDSGSN